VVRPAQLASSVPADRRCARSFIKTCEFLDEISMKPSSSKIEGHVDVLWITEPLCARP